MRHLFRSKLRGYTVFVGLLSALAVFLFAAGRLPSVFQDTGVSSFDSIEEARRRLKIRDITVPAYFPEPLSWPPSSIIAGVRPYEFVAMEFRRPESAGPILIISQIDAAALQSRTVALKMTSIAENTSYTLKGRNAKLLAGECGKGSPCSRIEWIEGSRRITVSIMSVPSELVRIAESMIR